MAALIEINQVGKREDLRDFISITDAKEKPFLAMVPKVPKAVNMLMEWQVDKYDTLQLAGVADGVDVSTYENAAKDRAVAANYCQKFRRTAMVGDIAENVSNVAGARSGELARALEKKIEELSRDIEASLCAVQGAQTETDSNTPYKTRGLGKWIDDAPSGTLETSQIPAAARPPSASHLDYGSAGEFIETDLQGVLASMFTQHGRSADIDMLVGTTIKQAISGFTQTSNTATTDMPPGSIRSFTQSLESRKITHNVTLYEGDFNTVRIHTSLLLAASDGGTAGSVDVAYALPMEMWGLAFNRQPRIMRLPDMGGGPRACVDAICGLIARNPSSSGHMFV